MVKTKAKYIITLVAIFIAMCLLNVSTVQAVEMTETDLQGILDAIPDTMNLDIPEIEYEKSGELVKANIKKVLNAKNYQYEDIKDSVKLKDVTIDGYNIEMNIDTAPIYLGLDNFYKAYISIHVTDGNTEYANYRKSKTIKLVYNNHSNYNTTDEEYIKNLKIENKRYFEVDLDYKVKNQDSFEWFDNHIAEYYTDVINDSSIVVKAVTGAGTGEGINLYTSEHGTDIGIFKNGILYEIRSIGHHTAIPVINVLDTMTDTEINDYVVKTIKDTYSDYGQYVTSITKGVEAPSQEYTETYSKIPDIYTVNTSAGPSSLVIIRKYETVEAKLQAMLDLIPNTMELDIPEVEFEKSKEIILSRVKEILKNASIQYEDIEDGVKLKDLKIDGNDIVISSSVPPIYTIIDEFYSTSIYINTINEETSYNKGVKTIKLKYNNTEKRNLEDEEYVKNLKIESPFYYEVPLDYMSKGNTWNEFFKVVGDYHTKLIGDNSIIVKAEAGAGGADGSLNIGTHGLSLAIFKNGILYEIRGIKNASSIPVVNVPSTIAEEKVNDYVIELIKKYYPEYGNTIIKIEKGTQGLTQQYGEIDIPNSYTIYGSDMESYIIIRKEKAVTSLDNETKIKFETTSTVVPEDTTLKVEEIKEETTLNTIKESLKEISNKYVVFDISLVHNNEEIQPNGKVKISIPVPDGYDTTNLVVFRIEADGSKVEFKVNVVEIEGTKYAQFETDHFSNYVLAEKTAEKAEPEDNSNRVLDDQPKTGIFDIKLLIGIAMVVFTVIVVKNKRKNA